VDGERAASGRRVDGESEDDGVVQTTVASSQQPAGQGLGRAARNESRGRRTRQGQTQGPGLSELLRRLQWWLGGSGGPGPVLETGAVRRRKWTRGREVRGRAGMQTSQGDDGGPVTG
jgi:hypothetical protein